MSKLTDEQREDHIRNIKKCLGSDFAAPLFDEFVASEQAWKEEAEKIETEQAYAKRQAIEWNDKAVALKEQLNQAIEVLKWYAVERPHSGTIVTAALNDNGKLARQYLSTLSQEGEKPLIRP